MRILLDENVDPRRGVVPGFCDHQAVYVSETRYRGTADTELVELARDFHAFVTLDLHRQSAEWLAISRALIEGGVRVARVRLPPGKPATFLALLRSVILRSDGWDPEFASGACLITLTALGSGFRARTPEEVRLMLTLRADPSGTADQ